MIALIDVLRDACLDMGDASFSHLGDLLRRSKQVMLELGLVGDTGSSIITKMMERDPVTKVISLPEDFMQPVKIGFIWNGNFIGFGHNPKMQPPLYDNCGDMIPVRGGNSKGMPAGRENFPPGYGYDDDGFPSAYPYWGDGFAWGEGYMRWYGAASGWSDGYFRFDSDANVLQFSSEVVIDKVLVRYRSTGFVADAPTYVLPQWHEAIKYETLVKKFSFGISTNADREQLETFKRLAAKAKTNAIKATHGSTLAQMVDVMRQTGGGAPRR